MNKNIIKLVAIIAYIIISFAYVKSLKIKNGALSNNQETLLTTVEKYKVADSLNAAKINALQLSLSEYKKYRAEDAELIKKLKADKVSSATSATLVTTTKIETKIKDSIVYINKFIPIDTIKSINFRSEWITVNGMISNNSVSLDIVNREHLIVVESLVRKKLWFIKLPVKIFGYKTKSVDVISKNPNTEITDLEFIQISKQ